LRQTLPAAFQARFGIAMEYLGGRTSEQALKLISERQAGIYTIDAALSGIDSFSGVFTREQMLAPLRPAFVLPDVLDGSKWKKGKLWFSDPQEQYVLRLTNHVSTLFHINTSKVKRGDMHSAQDLLDPKWQGKIALEDPLVAGSGSNHAAHLYLQLGKDYVRKLFIDQKPMISRDKRQLMDGLLRGIYPIAMGVDDQDANKMQREGMPIEMLQGFSDLYLETSGGSGLLGLFNRAPHPNAAKVFVNWMASKEGLDVYARAREAPSTRKDVDESYLSPEVIPREGVKYFDQDWDYAVSKKEQAREQMQDIFREMR
jgi:ABC-type Fe3+ transport system substrate-binding protein